MASSNCDLHDFWDFLEQRIAQWYCDWLKRSYFIPPVFMNRTYHTPHAFGGENVHVIKKPIDNCKKGSSEPILLDSDVRNDRSQQKVLKCFADIQDEVMFVISQLKFGDYLDCLAYNAAQNILSSLFRPADKRIDGDFDVLIISRRYGIMVGEIKSVGSGVFQNQTEQEQDMSIQKRCSQAVKQLAKSKEVLDYLVSDLSKVIRVKTALMLPYLGMERLQRCLKGRSTLSQMANEIGSSGLRISHLNKSFNRGGDKVLIDLLTEKTDEKKSRVPHMSLTSESLDNPEIWWRSTMTSNGPDPAMTDDLYLKLIARFAGPATTIKVHCSTDPHLALRDVLRTEGEAVSETGWRFTQVVLHPEQLSLLQQSPPLMFLTGPPGTGKTLMLALRARELLRRGEPVHVLCMWSDGLAAFHSLVHQISDFNALSARRLVHRHTFDFVLNRKTVIAEAVRELTESLKPDEWLHILVDEPIHMKYTRFDTKRFSKFVDELLETTAGKVTLWAASVNKLAKPDKLEKKKFRVPLRTPPIVTKEVELSVAFARGDMCKYAPLENPTHCEGQTPIRLYHRKGSNQHDGDRPSQCHQCGCNIGSVLKYTLFVGETAAPGKQPLHFWDVLVMTSAKAVVVAEDGVVKGLEEMDIPVYVLHEDDEKGIEAMATMSIDKVMVTGGDVVQGQERSVVVWLERYSSNQTIQQGDESFGRIQAMSLCTAQLVLVLIKES